MTHTNLKAVYLRYVNSINRDERGEIYDQTPDVMVIASGLKFTAQEILNSTLIPSSMDNTTNVLSAIVTPMEWAYISDADGWYLGKKKQGLMATDRQDVSIDFWQDETNKDYFASIFTRWGGAVTNWRFWYACNIATS